MIPQACLHSRNFRRPHELVTGRNSWDVRAPQPVLSRGERNAVAVRISQKVAVGVVFVSAMFMSIMDVRFTRVNIR